MYVNQMLLELKRDSYKDLYLYKDVFMWICIIMRAF